MIYTTYNKTPAQTNAQRKASERQRHKDAGRVAITVYVRREFAQEVRALEKKLRVREVIRVYPK